ncbi:hypothetical protein J6590_008387 [Homalodisca vitripennis]|nr:hypothetical protein J6590_008387 [Homalodisca vitripennis]
MRKTGNRDTNLNDSWKYDHYIIDVTLHHSWFSVTPPRFSSLEPVQGAELCHGARKLATLDCLNSFPNLLLLGDSAFFERRRIRDREPRLLDVKMWKTRWARDLSSCPPGTILLLQGTTRRLEARPKSRLAGRGASISHVTDRPGPGRSQGAIGVVVVGETGRSVDCSWNLFVRKRW